MRRGFAILASACVFLGLGCAQNYDIRLGKTLEDMRYRKRLDDNLLPAPTKGKLQQSLIFVRPPLGLKGPFQAFGMTVVEPGRFDVTDSFIDEQKGASLHLLARVKQPKTPNKKGAAAEATPRGDFNTDVIDLVKTAYGVDVELNQFKATTKSHDNRTNNFKAKTLDLGAKEVQIYLYGEKNSPYEVALIYEYPKGEHNNLDPKIGLSLESFAVGEAARRSYSGIGDEEGGEEGAQPPGGAF
jgi:hypothetical protein